MAIAVLVPHAFLKPYCPGLRRLLASRCLCSRLFIIFSRILPGVSSREMGRKFSGLSGGLPAFGMRAMVACLNIVGKCQLARAALNR